MRYGHRPGVGGPALSRFLVGGRCAGRIRLILVLALALKPLEERSPQGGRLGKLLVVRFVAAGGAGQVDARRLGRVLFEPVEHRLPRRFPRLLRGVAAR